mmetsp:Transcript_23402/g.54677  ORF Transcript_23402/g.54677 Transcript_23402/m.54677 type:complete len:202 (-) Transcript_23402:168-773(-)
MKEYTWSGGGTAETSTSFPISRNLCTIGTLSLTKVRNLLTRVSSLSSARPLVSPLFIIRARITSSGQSKYKTIGTSTSFCIMRCQPRMLSSLRGNPSTRKRDLPLFRIALRNKLTVTSTGTIWPSLIIVAIIAPSSDSLATSARRRSPADRCVQPKSLTMLAHCVPLPHPGPPRTKTTHGFTRGRWGLSTFSGFFQLWWLL